MAQNYDMTFEMFRLLKFSGWMVLLILVYNMMGASQVVPIYMFVKILYSAFLFLHGWNQFIAYLQRGDYGVVRFLQDLFRLNVMAVLLCLCMNRPYQFYEFVSSISSRIVNMNFVAFIISHQLTHSFFCWFLDTFDIILDVRSLC